MKILLILFCLVVVSCKQQESKPIVIEALKDTVQPPKETIEKTTGDNEINTANTTPEALISYAQTLIGTPYKYGSADPTHGFDCSGFITYVFNHFNIDVPRSSIDFTDIKREVGLDESKPGDIVLFTGTDNTIRHVGHMGIITSRFNNQVDFIHSTSGKANGVTITPLNKYYMGRFVKVIRIFKQNESD